MMISQTTEYALRAVVWLARQPDEHEAGYVEFFNGLKAANGDCLIAFGWILAEDLLKYNG